MFPGPKVTDEAAESADGELWWLGPVDLERGVVEVHRPSVPDEDDPAG